MNLKFDLDNHTIETLHLQPNEEIWYCVPRDLSREDQFLTNAYVVVTNRRLCLLSDGVVSESYMLSVCKKLDCETMINSAVLRLYFKDGSIRFFARCTMKHIVRFSYVARGATMLMQGRFYRVESMEYEATCPKCGAILQNIRTCPNCGGRGSSLKKAVVLCKPFAPQFLVLSLFTLLSSALALAGPKIRQVFIDTSLADKSGTLNDVARFILLMLAIAVGNIVLNTVRNIFSTYLGARMAKDLRSKMFQKVQKLALARIEDMKPGQLMNRITNDTTDIRRFMENTFASTLSTIVTMAGALIYMMVIDWKLTLLSLVFVPFMFMISYFLRGTFSQKFRREREKRDSLNSRLQDVISGISVVKSFGKEDYEVEGFRKLNRELTDVLIQNYAFFYSLFPAMNFILNLGTYLITYAMGVSVLRGAMTVGVLMQMVAYAGNLYGPLETLTRLPRELSSLFNNVERIYDVLEEEEGSFQSEETVDIDLQGDIEFDNVCFGYKSYEPVLNDINLHIRPGEMIGLVGASGTGKSTMINLIMHLYQVDSGVLKIDGADINQIRQADLRKRMGVVLQETFLFNGSILDNIRFSRPEASLEEVIHAAKMANAHDFIIRTPDGYNTNVGERGYNLSGGERQRIAIARAVLIRPKLLILDEATSNLDTESEYLIQNALERLEKQCTTIAIAHRLSTLKNADRLVVIDNHHIIEEGSHEELLKKKGVYYGLVTAQLEMAKVG